MAKGPRGVSLSLRPAPIIRENGYVRHPTDDEHEFPWKGEWGYLITRVANTTALRPGIVIDQDRVDQLIDNGAYVVVLSKRR